MAKAQTIMIVDDDEDDVELFRDALKEVDDSIKCICSINGEDALDKLSNGNEAPDYIFLDLNMPRLNGKQCLQRIKANVKLRHIPVIIYTTSKLKEDMEETKRMGALMFLTKPNRGSELRKAISFILQGKYEVANNG
ncbi:MAG: response regulator [Flavitalea sp.]